MDNGTEIREKEALKYSAYSLNPSRPNGTMITLIVGSIPIIILCLIILGFKICYRLCPQGQRRAEFHLPRRISTFSSFSSMSRSSSVHHMSHLQSPMQSRQGSSHHLNLHHIVPHHHPPTIRADGTPLVPIELETISEQIGLEPDIEAEGEDSCPFTSCPH